MVMQITMFANKCHTDMPCLDLVGDLPPHKNCVLPFNVVLIDTPVVNVSQW